MSSALMTACLCDLARHFKTEPTETVALCFGYPKTLRVLEPIDTVSTMITKVYGSILPPTTLYQRKKSES
jgi:hypothetical protein